MCFIFGATLASLLKNRYRNCPFYIMVLFGMNLKSKIITKASKKAPYSMPNFHFFGVYLTLFCWVIDYDNIFSTFHVKAFKDLPFT